MEKQSFLDDSRCVFCCFCCMDCGYDNWRIYCLVDLNFVFMKFRFPLKILHLYVMISILIFLFVLGLERFTTIPDFIRFYLNDFLVIPIVGLVCLHVVWFLKKDRTIRLNIFTILSLVILFSVYFEWYLPKIVARYTGDFWDVVCYFAGGFMFYIFQKQE